MMNLRICSLAVMGLFGSSGLVQAMPLSNGTVISESITYSIGDPDSNDQFLTNLRLGNFRQYDGQVILLMYHASW